VLLAPPVLQVHQVLRALRVSRATVENEESVAKSVPRANEGMRGNPVKPVLVATRATRATVGNAESVVCLALKDLPGHRDLQDRMRHRRK
jgi:hypothetical protein